MNPDLKSLIELQQVDSRLTELGLQIETIPTRIRALEAQLSAFLRSHEEHKLRLSANQKERRDLEGEIKVIQEKISRHKDQLYQVKTNEQFRAMQREIEGEEQNIRRVEDRILDKMVEAEALQVQVQQAAARVDEEKTRVASETKRLESIRQADEGERLELVARRSVLAEGLNPAHRETYERVRRGRQGIAVAEVRDGLCTACNVRLRPQMYNEVRTGNAIVTCDSCSRILYYVEQPAEPTAIASGENQRVGL